MPERLLDPRIVANALLSIADELGLPITHLALQKLLYFAHGLHLIDTGKPLVSGYFEAWQNGPVHPTVYHAFKSEGRTPIQARAMGIDLVTRKSKALPPLEDGDIQQRLRRVVEFYGPVSPGRLRALSHAKNGPWWVTVNKKRKSVALGMRITDDVTKESFKYQYVSIADPNEADHVDEIASFASNGLGADRAPAD